MSLVKKKKKEEWCQIYFIINYFDLFLFISQIIYKFIKIKEEKNCYLYDFFFLPMDLFYFLLLSSAFFTILLLALL